MDDPIIRLVAYYEEYLKFITKDNLEQRKYAHDHGIVVFKPAKPTFEGFMTWLRAKVDKQEPQPPRWRPNA